MAEQFDPPKQSIAQRIIEIASSNFKAHDKYKAKGWTPQRARSIIEEAKAKKETLKDDVVAVGSHFDNGMNHLDIYSQVVEKYENKGLSTDDYRKWRKSLVAMGEDGLFDVAHTVVSSRPVLTPAE